MNDSASNLWQEPGVRYYLGVCCAGMGVLFPVLNQRGVTLASMYIILLVAVVGLAALLARPPAGPLRSILDALALRTPVIFLVTLLVLFTMRENRILMSFGGDIRLSDMLLCAGVLGFVAGHYRLQAVVKNVFPERAAPDAAADSPRRTGHAVTPVEVSWLLLALPTWASLAQLTAVVLPTARANPGLMPDAWRAIALAWLVAAIGLTVSSLLDYHHRRHMSAVEATLYLQDVVWQQTRREQRRINRWAAWGRRGCPRSLGGALSEWLACVGLAALIAACVMAVVYLITLLE